jgi:glutathione synthase
MKWRVLWVTDPWDTLDHPRDTPLRLAEECLALGVECHWCDFQSIRWDDAGIRLDARRLESISAGRARDSFQLGPVISADPREFSSIHYRTDPPVDHTYLHSLQLLMLGTGGVTQGTEIINPADILLGANEKMEAALLGDLMPATRISSRKEILEDFAHREGRTVLKPLHQAQSKGVEFLDWTNEAGLLRASRVLREATADFSRPVLLQRYIEAIHGGEVRLWFIDGRLLAWIRKLPLTGDFRVHIDRGSSLAATELSAGQRQAAEKIGRHLKSKNIRLAAVDLIQTWVTDFNFISPGLITQMESVLGTNLARPIIEALIKR